MRRVFDMFWHAPEHGAKKLFGFFEQNIFKLFEPERLLVDQMCPSGREVLSTMIASR
jgi:hypothetical protein